MKQVDTGQKRSWHDRYIARLKAWHSPTTKTVDQINSMPPADIPVYLGALNKRERRAKRNLTLASKNK